jgi:hypothetical protein
LHVRGSSADRRKKLLHTLQPDINCAELNHVFDAKSGIVSKVSSL